MKGLAGLPWGGSPGVWVYGPWTPGRSHGAVGDQDNKRDEGYDSEGDWLIQSRRAELEVLTDFDLHIHVLSSSAVAPKTKGPPKASLTRRTHAAWVSSLPR